MKKLFAIHLQFGFGSFTDEETVYVEAHSAAEAETFALENILDRQESGEILIPAREVSFDDMPDGEAFWNGQ